MWIIDEDLSAIQALADEHGHDMLKRMNGQVSVECLADLEALGFKKEISGTGLRIYIHAQKELVLKVSYICSDDHCEVPKRAAPSIVLMSGGHDGKYAVVLQPLVDCSPEVQNEVGSRIYDLPIDEIRKLFGRDFAFRNVGRWKGQDVAIDW